MACTKYTIVQYNALIEAMTSGASKVQYGDKTVEYRSLDDMIRLRIDMERCLFPQNNTNNGKTYASFSKGTFKNGRRRC